MLVSVIVPCYNVSEYIEDCLASVFKQSHSELEVICVDNGSTDGTLQKLQHLKETMFPRLQIISETKRGANAARNRGLKVAKGEWIQFLDADDLLDEHKITNQLQLLGLYPDAGYIAAGFKKLKMNNTCSTEIVLNSDKYVSPFIRESGNTCSNLWSRDKLMEVGGWDENLRSSQETELMLRLVLSGASCCYQYAAETIIRERLSGQISQTDPVARWTQYIDIRLNYLDQLKRNYPEVYHNRVDIFLNYLLGSVLVLLKYNRSMAINYYNRIFSGKWNATGGYGVTRTKARLIKMLGISTFSVLRVIAFR